MKQPGLVKTFSGRLFNILEPDPDDFDIHDIAHQLAMTCRWGGACQGFYSVAQHSFYVSYMVAPEKAKAALLHDGTEAYMRDIPLPLKALLPDYKAMEDKLGCHLALAFDLPVDAFEDPEVKAADDRIQAMEAAVMINTPDFAWCGGRPDGTLYDIDATFKFWPPEFARHAFTQRYFELRNAGL